MKQIKSLRQEIINRMWNMPGTDVKRSPNFHKWLEDLLMNHSLEIINECAKVPDECDYKNDVPEAIRILKKQL